MTEEEYKQEWLNGMHQTEYNACRFSDDKVKFCEQWLNTNVPDWKERTDIVSEICNQKMKIALDASYRDKCQKFADKLTAPEEVCNIIGKRFIIPTYKLDTIEESKNYVVGDVIFKCNHGSGWNKSANMKTSNLSDIETKLKEWMSLNYAYISGYEAQYENIIPSMLVQPRFNEIPMDWGFWCVNGEIEGVSLTKKLSKNLEQYIGFVNKNGKYNSWLIGCTPSMRDLPGSWNTRFEEMKEIATTLSKGFDFVRVDLYNVNKETYFGEMTFTPCSGRLVCKKTNDV